MSPGPSSSPHTTPDESTVLPVECTPQPCASGCDTLEQVNPTQAARFCHTPSGPSRSVTYPPRTVCCSCLFLAGVSTDDEIQHKENIAVVSEDSVPTPTTSCHLSISI